MPGRRPARAHLRRGRHQPRAKPFGNDTILDFTPRSDKIRFDNNVFFDLSELDANMMRVGDDVVIQRSPGHTFTLENVTLASLGAGDFLFT